MSTMTDSSTLAIPSPARTLSRRRLLMIAGPVVAVVAATTLWLNGGRYIATDNAYVKADKLNLAPDVAGYVAAISVKEGDRVTAGQALFRIDDSHYRITLAGAEAQLALARNQILTLQANYRANQAQVTQAHADVDFYKSSFDRQTDLAARGVSSQNALDTARRDTDAANARLTLAERQAAATLAQLGGQIDTAPERQPSVMAAQAQVDKARLDLDHTIIKAPANGIVTNVSALQVGQYMNAAQAAFSLVSTDNVWVEANPKESDLTYMKPGDPATVTIDSYPGRTITARVTSISPATGAEFSVLPAQNSSGNWVKVVQRVPIRLALDLPADAPRLRAGMSANISIDTGHTRTLSGLFGDIAHMVGG